MYSPLNESKKEIRLVNVLPSSTGCDDIFCTLSKICLSNDRGDPTRYVAVSYVWGDPKATETIFVNGTAFQATKALVSFLRHYSHIPAELHRLPLWIDEFASTLCVEDFDPLAEQTGMPKNKA